MVAFTPLLASSHTRTRINPPAAYKYPKAPDRTGHRPQATHSIATYLVYSLAPTYRAFFGTLIIALRTHTSYCLARHRQVVRQSTKSS